MSNKVKQHALSTKKKTVFVAKLFAFQGRLEQDKEIKSAPLPLSFSWETKRLNLIPGGICFGPDNKDKDNQ